MNCKNCPNVQEILDIIDEEYTLWENKKIEAENKMADILARRIEYQLATIRRIRKKIMGISVDYPSEKRNES